MTTALATDIVRILVVGVAVFYVLLPMWASREWIAWGIKRGTVAFMGAIVVHQVAIAKGIQPGPAILAALVCGWLAAQMVPARSRYIPPHEKRKENVEDEERKTQTT